MKNHVFLVEVFGVVSSGLLMAPANIYAYDPNQINTSLLFRQLSASVLLLDTLVFYLIFYLSKTIRDMKREGVILIFTSSVLCLIAAIFNLIQAISLDYYNEINSNEGWFYGFQIAPIILAHFTWSILHPKRSLTDVRLIPLITKEVLILDDQDFQKWEVYCITIIRFQTILLNSSNYKKLMSEPSQVTLAN